MAKRKNKNQVKPDSPTGESLQPEALFPLKGYIILNILFWAYCLIQLLVLTWLFRDVVGLIFFFIVLGVGFTLVSIYDYVYDRIAYKKTAGENKADQSGSELKVE